MGRDTIAQRMGGTHARRKDKGPNYSKVLFSHDDMASFEALLDEVNHVEAQEFKHVDKTVRSFNQEKPSWRERCCNTWTVINAVVLIALLGGSLAIYEMQLASRPAALREAIEEAEEKGRGGRHHHDVEAEAAAAEFSADESSRNAQDAGDGWREGVVQKHGDDQNTPDNLNAAEPLDSTDNEMSEDGGKGSGAAKGKADKCKGVCKGILGNIGAVASNAKSAAANLLRKTGLSNNQQEEQPLLRTQEEDGKAETEMASAGEREKGKKRDKKEGRKEKSTGADEGEGFLAKAKKHIGSLLNGGGDGVPSGKKGYTLVKHVDEDGVERSEEEFEMHPDQRKRGVESEEEIQQRHEEEEILHREKLDREEEEHRKRLEQEEKEHREKLEREEEEHRKRLEEEEKEHNKGVDGNEAVGGESEKESEQRYEQEETEHRENFDREEEEHHKRLEEEEKDGHNQVGESEEERQMRIEKEEEDIVKRHAQEEKEHREKLEREEREHREKLEREEREHREKLQKEQEEIDGKRIEQEQEEFKRQEEEFHRQEQEKQKEEIEEPSFPPEDKSSDGNGSNDAPPLVSSPSEKLQHEQEEEEQLHRQKQEKQKEEIQEPSFPPADESSDGNGNNDVPPLVSSPAGSPSSTDTAPEVSPGEKEDNAKPDNIDDNIGGRDGKGELSGTSDDFHPGDENPSEEEDGKKIPTPPSPDEDATQPKVKGIVGAGDYNDELDKWVDGN